MNDKTNSMLRVSALPVLVLWTLLSFMACGEDKKSDLPGEEIDCTWFAASNCWRDSLFAFAALLPATSELGVLAPDGKSCEYQSGLRFVFANPIDPERLGQDNYLDNFQWDFTADLDGDFLMSYREPDVRTAVLQTSLGFFNQVFRDSALGLGCPDGSQYKVSVPALLQLCDPLTLPGRKTFWDETGVIFAFKGTGTNDLVMFNCRVE